MTLSFEEADQLANPTRLRAFIKQYGLGYTVLLAGVPDDVEAKVPQAVNLNAFPTTFLLGRDGRVRAVHAGFPESGQRRVLLEGRAAHHGASGAAPGGARIGHVLGFLGAMAKWLTRRPAKPLFEGSNPSRASSNQLTVTLPLRE